MNHINTDGKFSPFRIAVIELWNGFRIALPHPCLSPPFLVIPLCFSSPWHLTSNSRVARYSFPSILRLSKLNEICFNPKLDLETEISVAFYSQVLSSSNQCPLCRKKAKTDAEMPWIGVKRRNFLKNREGSQSARVLCLPTEVSLLFLPVSFLFSRWVINQSFLSLLQSTSFSHFPLTPSFILWTLFDTCTL